MECSQGVRGRSGRREPTTARGRRRSGVLLGREGEEWEEGGYDSEGEEEWEWR